MTSAVNLKSQPARLKFFATMAKTDLARAANSKKLIEQLERLEKSSLGFEQIAYRIVIVNLKTPKNEKAHGLLDEELTKLNSDTHQQIKLLEYISKVEDTIVHSYKNYSRINIQDLELSKYVDSSNADIKLDHDFSSLKVLAPEVYKRAITMMNQSGVLKILSKLDPETKPHLDSAEIQKVFKLSQKLEFYASTLRKQSFHEASCLLESLRSKIHKIAEHSSSIHQFQSKLAQPSDADNPKMLNLAVSGLKKDITVLHEEIQSFFHNFVEPSKTVDYVELNKFARINKRNNFLSGIGKVAVTLIVPVLVAFISSGSSAPDKETDVQATVSRNGEKEKSSILESDKAATDTQRVKNESNIEKSSSKLSGFGSSTMVPAAEMGSAGCVAGEIKAGALVYTAEAKVSPHQTFLLTGAYQHQGAKKIVCSRTGVVDPSNLVTQTITTAPSNYKKGESISLVLEPNSKVSDIKTNKPCNFSLNQGQITFEQDVRDVTITYKLLQTNENPRFNRSVFVLEQERLNSQTAQSLRGLEDLRSQINHPSDVKIHLPQYLSPFKYIISSELDDLVTAMPGLQERNLSFLRFGDCDMLANHVSWALQDRLCCAVGVGYLDRNADGNIYEGDAHARLLVAHNKGLEDHELTSNLSAAFIFPEGQSFRPEDLKQLRNLVAQMNETKNQEHRDQLMTEFAKGLDLILQNDYYKQFHPKTGAIGGGIGRPESQSGEETKDGLGDTAKFMELVNNPFLLTALAALSTLYATGLASLARKKQSRSLPSFTYQPFIVGTKTIIELPSTLKQSHTRRWREVATNNLTRDASIIAGLASKSSFRKTGTERTAQFTNGASLDASFVDGLSETSFALLKTISFLKDTQVNILHGIMRPNIHMPIAMLVPEYKPTWYRFTRGLESLQDQNILSTRTVVDLFRKHFEIAAERKKKEEDLDYIVRRAFRGLQDRVVKPKMPGLSTNTKRTAGTKEKQVRSNRQRGGVEFESHRNYAPGDELRIVDWKAFGRRNPEDIPPVKIFTDEDKLSDKRNHHSIGFVIDCQTLATDHDAEYLLSKIADVLKARWMKSNIELGDIEIYSFGTLVKRISSKDIGEIMSRGASGARDLITQIIQTAHENAVYSDLITDSVISKYSSEALPVSADYSQCNIWTNRMELLFDRLEGKELAITPMTNKTLVVLADRNWNR